MADRVKRSEVDLGLFRQRRVSPQAPEGQWSRESRAAESPTGTLCKGPALQRISRLLGPAGLGSSDLTLGLEVGQAGWKLPGKTSQAKLFICMDSWEGSFARNLGQGTPTPPPPILEVPT